MGEGGVERLKNYCPWVPIWKFECSERQQKTEN